MKFCYAHLKELRKKFKREQNSNQPPGIDNDRKGSIRIEIESRKTEL